MADHFTITEHLRDLNNEDLMRVGGALGLYYPHMHRMNPLLEELVAAWLNREDNVLSASGHPSWASLIKALRDIHQPGIAQEIEEGMLDCSRAVCIGCSMSCHVLQLISAPTDCGGLTPTRHQLCSMSLWLILCSNPTWKLKVARCL